MQIGGRLLIASQLEQSCDGPIRNREQQLDHIYYTLLWPVKISAAPFTSLSKLCKYTRGKLVSCAKPACFDFLHSILMCRVTYSAQLGMLLEHHYWCTVCDSLK
jgi:hypothetical protein